MNKNLCKLCMKYFNETEKQDIIVSKILNLKETLDTTTIKRGLYQKLNQKVKKIKQAHT